MHVSDWAPPQCDNPEGEADASKASDQDSPGVGKAAASGGCGAPSASPSSDDQPGMEPCVSESGGIGKGKGAQERPVIDITASAGQESAQPPQKGDDTAATESIAANAAASTPCSGAGGLAEAAAAPAEANAAVNGNPQTTKAGTNAKWEVPAFIAATDSTQQSQSSFAFGSQGPTSHSNSSAPFCPQRPSLFDPLSGTPRGPSVGSTPLEDRPSLSRFTSEQQSSSPAAFTFGQKLAFPSASCSFGQQATLFGQQTTAPAVSQPFGQHTAASGGLTAFAFSAASRFDQAASPERAARPFAFGQQAPASADAGQSEEQPFKFSFGQGVGSAPVSQP